MENTKKSLFFMLILPVIWGAYYVAGQKLVGYTSVFVSGIGIRFITMIFLSIIMWKRGELHSLFETKGVVKKLILIGVFGFLLDATAFVGLSLSSATSGSALLKCDILMVNVMSMLIYKQRFPIRIWLYTILMLVGVVMVMGIDFSTFKIADPGNIFFLLSAFFVSCNAFIIKSAQYDKDNPVSDDVIAYYNNFVTMLIFIAAAFVSGQIQTFANFSTNGDAIFALLLASMGQTCVYMIYYYNLRHHPVWLVKTFLLFMPIVSNIIMFVLFREKMVFLQYIGMVIILLGALCILFRQRNQNVSNEVLR